MKLITERIEKIGVITEKDESTGKKNFFIHGVFLQGAIKNKNGRVYPIEILDKEVSRYIEEKVKHNRALGELEHPECWTNDIKVCTPSGFRNVSEIQVGDPIYTLDINTNKVVVQNVTKTIRQNYSGDVITLKGKHINTTVTPNHRFVSRDRKGNLKFVTADEIHTKSVVDIGHHSIVKCLTKDNDSGNTQTDTDEFVSIPPLSQDRLKKCPIRYKDKMSNGVEISHKDFAPFIAWYLSEGYSDNKKVNITQNSGEKAEILEGVLNNLKKYGIETIKKTYGNKNVYSIHDSRIAQYCEQFGKHNEKYIPSEIFNMNAENKAEFLLNYALGDGRFFEKNVINDIFSTSEKLIQQIVSLACSIGISCTIKKQICKKDYKFAGRIIKAENKKPLWFAKFLRAKNIHISDRFLKTEKKSYEGEIFCLQVPNQTLYIQENNGQSYWSGNSPSINLDRVSHKIISLVKEGNNYIGKAKILDTNCGQIVKSLLEEGVSLGVSSRGMGSLKQVEVDLCEVQDDFYLATAADIVAEPSAPDAFINGILEGKEWVKVDNTLIEKAYADIKQTIKKTPKRQTKTMAIDEFHKFLKIISKV